MIKKFLVFILFCLFITNTAYAGENKFGIHILETSEVNEAVRLVNSSGGDWGYITMVLRDDDLKKEKWQNFFDDCRRLHLIPIVRIATHMESGGFWAKPEINDLAKWPEFLGDLNWPVKQQIVVIFNEPNHAKEWGGEINPYEYTLVLTKLIDLFKQESNNFFILNAGFDQAADGRNGTMPEQVFLQNMFNNDQDIFNKIDGWSSHSYPNHGFIGLPSDVGKASIKGYEWEIELLKNLKKSLPIYITETGWPHREGEVNNNQFYKEEKVAQLLKDSFNIWEKDNGIKAITPFILNYPQVPFDHFSWIKKDGSYYKQFSELMNLSKNKGDPEQIESFQIINLILADLLPTDYLYKGKIIIKNSGQWIIGEKKSFELEFSNNSNLKISKIIIPQGQLIYPNQKVELNFTLETGTRSAEAKIKIKDKEYTTYIFKPFDLKNNKISLWKQVTTKLKLWWQDFKEK